MKFLNPFLWFKSPEIEDDNIIFLDRDGSFEFSGDETNSVYEFLYTVPKYVSGIFRDKDLVLTIEQNNKNKIRTTYFNFTYDKKRILGIMANHTNHKGSYTAQIFKMSEEDTKSMFDRCMNLVAKAVNTTKKPIEKNGSVYEQNPKWVSSFRKFLATEN